MAHDSSCHGAWLILVMFSYDLSTGLHTRDLGIGLHWVMDEVPLLHRGYPPVTYSLPPLSHRLSDSWLHQCGVPVHL